MNTLLLLPVLLPLAGGLLALLAGHGRPGVERLVGVVAVLLLLPVSATLLQQASGGVIQSYAIGDWPAPFGIVLVLDHLAAWMLLVTAIVGSGALLFGLGRSDKSGRHFHTLFQFQLLGINGAFLTGDLFNLFVFFEVLLIASYALLAHGSRPAAHAGRDPRRRAQPARLDAVPGGGGLPLRAPPAP